MANNLPSKILVVDNDEGVLNGVARGLETYKVQVVTAKDWQSALYQFNHHKLDLCLVSLELEDMPGGVLIQKWRNHDVGAKRNVAFILCTGMKRKSGDEALLRELGDLILLSKPIQIPALLSAMANGLGLAKERQKVGEIREALIEPFLAQQKFDKAAQVASEQLDPLGDRGLFLSAKVHLAANKDKEATEKLKRLVERDPHNMAYHNELGRLYLHQGNLEAARKSYETADKVAPSNLERINQMAELYMQLQLPEKSVAKFKELIKLTPEDPDLKFNLYERMYNAGFASHAQEFCRDTSTPKELIRHFNNRGVMHSKTSEHEKAIDEYAKALRYLPGSKELFRVLYNMAISHINMKTPDHLQKAHEHLLECLRLEPSFEKAREKLKITAKHAKAPEDPKIKSAS